MNGFMKTVARIVAGAGTAALVGCYAHSDFVDNDWPYHYNQIARHSVIDAFNAQANNGHVLDQTIWNWHFESEVDMQTGERRPTARLHPAGMTHLMYLIRRTPAPDFNIYLQTAQDIPYDPENGRAT